MAYDLHTHSRLSDGTQTVEELVRDVASNRLTGFALTDHDTTAGWDTARRTAQELGIDFLPGIEISCAAEGLSIHMLSYGQDPHYEPLLLEMRKARDSRQTRAQRMVELLSEDYPVTWAMVQEFVGQGATVGRPHIADALVHLQVVTSRSQAFEEILTTSSPYYVGHYAPHPLKVIELVRAARGIPVLAHPRARSRGKVASMQLIETMIDAGLGGLEIYHRDNAEADRAVLTELADRKNLVITGSSDYHGAGKPNRLGENSTPAETVSQMREQMFIKE